MGIAIACLLSAALPALASASPTFTTASGGASVVAQEVAPVKITIANSETTCAESTYTGTAPSASFTTLTVTPTYKSCTTHFKSGSSIGTSIVGFGVGECDYVLHSTGTFDLSCAEGKEVTVHSGTCVTHIPPQSGLGTVEYDTGTSGGKQDLTLTLDVSSIKETHTDGFLCPFEGGGTTENGVLEGELTATAFVGGGQVDLTDHGPTVVDFTDH